MTKPIFIISLPRSGSTLLQRLLSSSKEIKTHAEPWILLPFVDARNSALSYSKYGSNLSKVAINEFLNQVMEDEEYDEMLSDFARKIYEKAADGRPIYLDKTPRYCLIVHDLYRLFPEAKFIVLGRNPISVCSSIARTWSGNKWKFFNYKVDLYASLNSMVNFLSTHSRSSRVLYIKYEDLVSERSSQSVILKLQKFVGLKDPLCHKTSLSDLLVRGSMGDPTAETKYKEISSKSVSGFGAFLCNPIRRFWALGYIKWIGNGRLNTLGYNYSQLEREIRNSKGYQLMGSDLIRIIWGVIYTYLEPAILKDKINNLSSNEGHNNVGHR